MCGDRAKAGMTFTFEGITVLGTDLTPDMETVLYTDICNISRAVSQVSTINEDFSGLRS